MMCRMDMHTHPPFRRRAISCQDARSVRDPHAGSLQARDANAGGCTRTALVALELWPIMRAV